MAKGAGKRSRRAALRLPAWLRGRCAECGEAANCVIHHAPRVTGPGVRLEDFHKFVPIRSIRRL